MLQHSMRSNVFAVIRDDRRDRIRRGPVPIHKQVAADIAADIASGRLTERDILPGELSLAEIYGVSRVTIRSALLLLRKEKILVATQGLGTFVCGTRKEAQKVLAKLNRIG